ncbi:MAG: DUF2085 domain-containing protein [Acidobacteriia bacterium]|nr:DUF2085 domain-containing protein [Terriglobia bacterium]
MIPGTGRATEAEGPANGRWAVRLGAAGAVVFVAGAVLPAAIDAAGLPGGSVLRAAYHPLCHQMPSRSLPWAGHPVAVCARCAGLYLGGTLGLLLASLARRAAQVPPGLRWLALAAMPTALDVMAGQVFGAGLPNVPRLLLSLPAGFVAGLYLAAGLADLGGSRWTRTLPIFSGPR